MDACVIGVTDQGLATALCPTNAQAREGGFDPPGGEHAPPWDTYRDHVERAVRHIWVSHKPDHGFEGAMMENLLRHPQRRQHQAAPQGRWQRRA